MRAQHAQHPLALGERPVGEGLNLGGHGDEHGATDGPPASSGQGSGGRARRGEKTRGAQ